MNIKESVNKRVIIAINYIITSDVSIKKGDLAKDFKISPSKFSEILSERMSAGLDIINILCTKHNINTEWLLTGKGEMLKKTYYIEEPITDLVADTKVLYKPKSKAIDNNNILLLDYKERLTEKEKEIASLNQEIGVLKEKLLMFQHPSSRNVPDVSNISTPIPTKQNSDTAIVLPISDKTANLPKPKR